MTTPKPSNPGRRLPWGGLLIGLVVGALGVLFLVVAVGMPFALGHRNDLPLEKLYGDAAVSIASMQGGNQTNPVANNPRAIENGRVAYTGSCATCHGVAGDGKGMFGEGLYPPASNLRAHDTQEKSDAQLFWIVKNGLSFAGMPGFAAQYDDQNIWALVAYTRSLGKSNAQGALVVPTPTTEQLAKADPAGDAAARGAAVYFAQGCQLCHGAIGNGPGELGLRGGSREAQQVVRRGRPGMPAYDASQISDAQLNDMIQYLNTFPRGRG
ncbi:MAG: c-type cytochrome [Chloroflexi bacterium]|nr:c-type cytochrome [Chloroflexota bacterium]